MLDRIMSKIALGLCGVNFLIIGAIVVSIFTMPDVRASYAFAESDPVICDVKFVEPEPVVIEEPVVEEVIEEPVVEEPVYYEEEVYYEPEPVYYEEEVYYEPEPEYTEWSGAVYKDDVYIEGVLTKSGGVNYFNGRKETWYSQRVLPGGGLSIPGRTVNSNGLVCDGDGYICVAADDLPYGTVVETSLGMGKVYDCGVGSDNAIDIYTDW